MSKPKSFYSLVVAVSVLALVVLACGPSPEMVTPISTQILLTPTPAEQAEQTNPTPTLTTEVVEPGECTLNARFVADMTVPDNTEFPPSTAFVKTWRAENSGSCDWEAGTRLVYVSGDPLGGPTAVNVPLVAVGSYVDISVDFVSPVSPGTYHSNWQIESPTGTRFGDMFYVQIVVPAPTEAPTDTPPPPTDAPVLPTPYPVGDWPLNRFGDDGPVVTAIQYLLRAEGYSLTVDGSFGPQTRAAVQNFQTSEGLAGDGVVGPNTWEALIQGHTVQLGSSGDAVLAVQHLLLSWNMDDILIDGSFGPQTRGKVIDFQEMRGVTADGIVGPDTWKALVADL